MAGDFVTNWINPIINSLSGMGAGISNFSAGFQAP